MKRGLKTSLLSLALSLCAVPVQAETVAITGGKVAIGDGSAPIDNATVIVTDGRISAVGKLTPPAGARIIDASGKWVTPGLIAGFSRVGLVEVDGVAPSNDTAASGSPFSAAIDVAPAINPKAGAVAVSRRGGITRAVVAPATGRDLFAGQGAVIDLGADNDAVMRPSAFQFVELGESGAATAGGSRAAAHVQFRNALMEAREYARKPEHYGGRERDSMLMRLDAAALVPVVEGKTLLFVHVERASDILQALELRREFPALRLVLVGASEGWLVADKIAAAKVPVIASALNDLPAEFEMLAATQSNIGRMAKAGVAVAIGMINDNDARQARLETQYAGNLVALTKVPGATGLDWNAALAAMTSRPAEILGLSKELGTLSAGKRADVVIWDGDPLELTSAPVKVLIDGIDQPLTTHATRLRDRYMSLDESQKPRGLVR